MKKDSSTAVQTFAAASLNSCDLNGARPLRDLKVNKRILKLIPKCVGSQWSGAKMGEICSYFRVPVKRWRTHYPPPPPCIKPSGHKVLPGKKGLILANCLKWKKLDLTTEFIWQSGLRSVSSWLNEQGQGAQIYKGGGTKNHHLCLFLPSHSST